MSATTKKPTAITSPTAIKSTSMSATEGAPR